MKTRYAGSFSLLLCWALTAVPLMAAQQTFPAKSPADELVDVILSKGYKRIVVLPKVVSRTSGTESPVTGKNTVGALSIAWPGCCSNPRFNASIARGCAPW